MPTDAIAIVEARDMRDISDEPNPKYELVNITESLICAEILRQHGQEVIHITTPDDHLHPEVKSALGRAPNHRLTDANAKQLAQTA